MPPGILLLAGQGGGDVLTELRGLIDSYWAKKEIKADTWPQTVKLARIAASLRLSEYDPHKQDSINRQWHHRLMRATLRWNPPEDAFVTRDRYRADVEYLHVYYRYALFQKKHMRAAHMQVCNEQAFRLIDTDIFKQEFSRATGHAPTGRKTITPMAAPSKKSKKIAHLDDFYGAVYAHQGTYTARFSTMVYE